MEKRAKKLVAGMSRQWYHSSQNQHFQLLFRACYLNAGGWHEVQYSTLSGVQQGSTYSLQSASPSCRCFDSTRRSCCEEIDGRVIVNLQYTSDAFIFVKWNKDFLIFEKRSNWKPLVCGSSIGQNQFASPLVVQSGCKGHTIVCSGGIEIEEDFGQVMGHPEVELLLFKFSLQSSEDSAC